MAIHFTYGTFCCCGELWRMRSEFPQINVSQAVSISPPSTWARRTKRSKHTLTPDPGSAFHHHKTPTKRILIPESLISSLTLQKPTTHPTFSCLFTLHPTANMCPPVEETPANATNGTNGASDHSEFKAVKAEPLKHVSPYKPVGDFLSNISRFKIIESTLREGEQFAK
jgi:hypothetical protein